MAYKIMRLRAIRISYGVAVQLLAHFRQVTRQRMPTGR